MKIVLVNSVVYTVLLLVCSCWWICLVVCSKILTKSGSNFLHVVHAKHSINIKLTITCIHCSGMGHPGNLYLFLLLEHVWYLIQQESLLHPLRVLKNILIVGLYTYFIWIPIWRSCGSTHLNQSSKPRYVLGYSGRFTYFCLHIHNHFFLCLIGESPKTERWKDGSLCYSISTSAMSYRTDCCKGQKHHKDSLQAKERSPIVPTVLMSG